jgi:glycosyltransferase involved in cell wall biosynthesis
VDHGLRLPRAEIVFVHNLASEVERHVPNADVGAAVQREREFFSALQPDATVVANSKLVADALHAHFGVERARIIVLYPGYGAGRFTRERAAALRPGARTALGVDPQAPLVGFVTSGDFAKRGLDLFLDCALRIVSARADARFLVVGSKQLPEHARLHALVRSGVVKYRPKSRHPERWFAALDLFLYAARYEEFGMVLAEAQASGVPVLTSRLVGASECLPDVYSPWLLDRPEPAVLAERSLALLADPAARTHLVAAAAASVAAFDERAYVEGTLRLIAARSAGSNKR